MRDMVQRSETMMVVVVEMRPFPLLEAVVDRAAPPSKEMR